MTKLKYDFIDENHKRMHNALIAAGWSCENDKRVRSSITLYEWVYTYVDTSIIYFCKGFNTVFYTSSKPTCVMFYCKTFAEIADYFDITIKKRQLKIDYQQEYQPITKDNIDEVLEYNKSLGLKIDSIKKTDNYICYRQLINGKWENVRWGFAFNWLDHIELDLGKLNPIPKPKFDFVKYLLDNGWTSNNHNSACISSKRKTMMIVIKDYKFHHYDNSKQLYDCSEYNAKILIEMSNLGEKFQVSKELS